MALAAICSSTGNFEGAQALLPHQSSCCRGLFIFRGQGIPPIMKEECYDVDLYDWTKVDHTDPVSFSDCEISYWPYGML